MEALLDLVKQDKYLEYLQKNALAYKEGKTSFRFNGCSVPVVEFRVWCRAKLQKRYLGTLLRTPEAAMEIKDKLKSFGMWSLLFESEEGAEADVVECLNRSDAAIPYVDPLFRSKRVFDLRAGKWPLDEIALRYFRQEWLPSVTKHCIALAFFKYLNDNVLLRKYDLRKLALVYIIFRVCQRYSFLSKY